MSYCPECGHPANPGAKFCTNCGRAARAVQGEYKKESTVLLLALLPGLLVPGIAHFYLGKMVQGIFFLALGLILLAASFALAPDDWFSDWPPEQMAVDIAGIGVWIWQVISARRYCKEYNASLNDGTD